MQIKLRATAKVVEVFHQKWGYYISTSTELSPPKDRGPTLKPAKVEVV
jgi:hypothetical protein